MKVMLFSGICMVLSGCANLNTVYREVGRSPEAGRSFVVDAAQRSVVSVQRTTGSGETAVRQTIVCPEPYPDAIAAFFSSGSATAALTASDAASKQLQAAFATGSAVASFGTRTNSTVLLTNQLSANCFAHMNGATKDDGFMELQRRAQTFNLGVLAIERLTGTDRGDQATAVGKAGAQTGGGDDVAALRVAYDKTAAEAISAQTEVDKLGTDRAEKAKQVNAQSVVLQGSKDAAAKVAPSDTAATAAAEAEVAKQQATYDALLAQHSELVTKVEKAGVRLAQAKAEKAQANSRLQLAEGNPKASGAGSATNSTGTQSTSNKDVAEAVARIVNMVLLEAGRGEGCNTIILDFPKNPDKYAAGAGQALLKDCVANRELSTTALRQSLPAAK